MARSESHAIKFLESTSIVIAPGLYTKLERLYIKINAPWTPSLETAVEVYYIAKFIKSWKQEIAHS